MEALLTEVHAAAQYVIGWLAVQGLAVLYAMVVLFVGWRFARGFRRWSERFMAASDHLDPMVEQFVSSLVYYGVLAVTLITVLHLFGVQTASLVAVLGAASLAIGLALQGSLTSLAAGVMLLVIRPFNIGDYIEVSGQAGTVKKITLFMTELATYDNLQVMMPNNKTWGAVVVNYSVYPERMMDIAVRLDFDDDIDAALATLRETAQADHRVLPHPPPSAFVAGLGEDAVDLTLRLWANANDYWPLRRSLTREVKRSFDADNLTIPVRQVTLRTLPSADGHGLAHDGGTGRPSAGA